MKITILIFTLLVNLYSKNLSSFELYKYLNNIRAQNSYCAPKTHPLFRDENLEVAAYSHSVDMALNNFLRHNGSGTKYDTLGFLYKTKSNFLDRIKYFGFPLEPGNLIGENIAKIYYKKDDEVGAFKIALKNWLQDSPHCKILMNLRFTHAGISYYKIGDFYYFTLDLGEKH